MRFEFATASRIVFGEGVLGEVPAAARELGAMALLVTGRSPERSRSLAARLDEAGVGTAPFEVEGEPSVELVRRGVESARAARADLVISFGGGSAIDAGKAIAALLTNSGDVLDYIEVIGKAQPLRRLSAPFIAIPTTAGTGSEVTRNSVLASAEHRVKASLRSPFMLPRLAVVDPEMTYELPPAVTASTGLDALTQLIEPYVSVRANAMTDAICLEGIGRAAQALPRAWHDGGDHAARRDMALASLFGGLALANAGLGAVHGFAAPVGGMFPAPHGAVCAALLPYAMEANIRALRARAPASHALGRYAVVARALTGRADAAPEDGAAWVRRICQELEIPSLGTYGVRAEYVPMLVENAARASSMKGNPIALTAEEMAGLLARAL
jgi:alcohol dehydrogenase class IV